MSAVTLFNALNATVPVATEIEAAVALTDAYGAFASAATTGAVPITPAGVSLGKAAMLPALSGMSAPNAGALVIQGAVQAFWTAVSVGFVVSFPGSIASTPAPNAVIASRFVAQFALNVDGASSKASALSSVSSILVEEVFGGTATFPPSVVQLIL